MTSRERVPHPAPDRDPAFERAAGDGGARDAGAVPGRAMLEVHDLHKSYGEVEAVRGVSFDVHAGEVVVIIGPSGCGKSTTLRCLNLLEEPTGGTLRLDDRELDFSERRTLPAGRDLARFRARFGMVFQQFDLFAHKTAIENVMIGQVVVKKTPPERAREAARNLLRRVGLEGMEDRRPRELSGASSSGSPSPGRSRWRPRCCSSTR